MLEIKGAEIDPMFEKLYAEYYAPGTFIPIKTAAESGRVTILQVFFERILIGYLVAKIDTLFDGTKELAVFRALAVVKGKNPIAHVVSHGLREYARRLGLDSVRVHSDVRGLDALLEEAGYEFQENIFVTRIKK